MANDASKVALLRSSPQSLAALVKESVSPEDWMMLQQMVRCGQPIPVRHEIARYPECWDLGWFKAICACFSWLDRWNSGGLRAKGRRKDPAAPVTDITPPAIGWDLVIYDLDRSIIGDPASDIAKTYDLQFENVVAADGEKVALKALLEAVMDEVPFPKKRRHGYKTQWAKNAAAAINARHEKDSSNVKRTTPRSVENRMREFGLWPE